MKHFKINEKKGMVFYHENTFIGLWNLLSKNKNKIKSNISMSKGNRVELAFFRAAETYFRKLYCSLHN